MIVVLDTNIIISALRFGGKPRKLIDLCAKGKVDGHISQVTLTELEEVLHDKFSVTPDEWSHIEEALKDDLTVVRIWAIPEAPELRDRADLHVLAAAQLCQADYIVSGDKDLLVLGEYKTMPIVSITDFLLLLRQIPD